MLRIARRSRLVRDKWDREDYIDNSIEFACSVAREVCQDRPLLAPVADTPAEGAVGPYVGALAGAARGSVPATLVTVCQALRELGVTVRADSFLDQTLWAWPVEKLLPLTDADEIRLRVELEQRGMRPVAADTMKDALSHSAEQDRFDSLTDWAESLQWDGVERIEGVLPQFFGVADTAYHRAVGDYIFTTLAGRALVPGVKADMLIALIGTQGQRKTSTLEALAPEPEFVAEIDLSAPEDNIARMLRGKVLVELGEMRGMRRKGQDALKAWISRRWEEHVKKYSERTARYGRRCVLVGTGNEVEFLNDTTGARRYLPVRVGHIDVVGLAAAREQL
jgi:hypothetical protein